MGRAPAREGVIRAFQDVKLDISTLQIRAQLLEAENNRLRTELQDRKIAESQSSLREISLRLRQIEDSIEALKTHSTKAADNLSFETDSETETTEPDYETASVSYELSPPPTTDPLKDELLKSFQRNRKDIIKNQILKEIAKEPLSKNKLGDIIIKEKHYCSKASFYRYLDEMERDGLIGSEQREGKLLVRPAFSSSSE